MNTLTPKEFLAGLASALKRRLLWEGLLRLLAYSAFLSISLAGAFALGLKARHVAVAFYLLWPLGLARYAYTFYVLPKRRFRKPAELAAYAESKSAALDDRLLSATQLAESAPQVAASHSPELAEAFVTQVAEGLGTLSPQSLIERGPLRRAGLWALAALFGLALFAVLLPYPLNGLRLALLGRYTQAGSGAAQEFLAGDIRLNYRFPAYTGLEEQSIPSSSGDIEAYPGTEVTIEVRARKDADEAFLRFEPGGERPMKALGNGRFALSFTLDAAGSYRFVFDDEMDARSHPIKLRPDRLPSAFFSAPQSEIEVRENDVVGLRYRLEDDFGLTEATLVFEYLAGKERQTKRVPLKRFASPGKAFSGAFEWDLAPTPFSPGDRVSYYIEVKDNCAVGGAQLGRSNSQTLKIFSTQEHHKNLLEKEERLWEAMIGLLAKYLEQPLDPARITNDTILRALLSETIGEHRTILVDPLGELLRELKGDPLTPENVLHVFGGLAADFSELLTRYEQADRNASHSEPQKQILTISPWPLLQLRESSIGRLERAIADLYELLQKQKYDSMVSESQKLESLRDELRQLIEQYKKAPDEATREKIAALIKELKRRMNELMASMAKVQKELPEDYVNMEALPTQNIMDNLDKLDDLLKGDKPDDLAKEFENLSHDLNNMLDDLKKGSERLGDDLYSPEMAKFESMKKDLDQLIEKESELNTQTESQDAAWQEEVKRNAPRDLAGRTKALTNKIEQAQDALRHKSLDTPFVPPIYRDQALNTLESVKRALTARDLSAAAESAKTAQELLERLQSYLPLDNAPSSSADPRREARNRVDQATDKTREVAEELRKLMPDPQKLMSPEAKEAMRRLSERQGALKNQGQSLRQQIEEMGGDMPFMPGNSGETMRQVGQGLEQAQGELNGLKPGSAGGQQRRALNGMKQLKDGIEQAMQQMREAMKFGGMRPMPRGGQGQDGQNGELSREKVAIPEADEHKSPKELREDLLDAMKRKAPEAYDPQNRLYYKELVK